MGRCASGASFDVVTDRDRVVIYQRQRDSRLELELAPRLWELTASEQIATEAGQRAVLMTRRFTDGDLPITLRP